MNYMRPEITPDAIDYNAGDCPSDDRPLVSIEIQRTTEQSQQNHDHLNKETARKLNIEVADDAQQTDTPNIIIKSVRSIPALKPNSSVQSPSVTKVGESSLTISHVASGVDFGDTGSKTNVQRAIDLAARSLVENTGLSGTELYRCGVPGCNAVCPTDHEFLRHLMRHSSSSANFPCYHCSLVFDKPISLKNHIRIHAMHRFFCYNCNETSSLVAVITKHFNEVHYPNMQKGANETILLPLNKQSNDPDKDMFVVCLRETSSVEKFAFGLVERNTSRILSTKKFYMPDEVHMLPHLGVFPDIVSCKLCGYSSKIRSNIHRHLTKGDCIENSNGSAPSLDPINPVPCLDTGERHFDKMRNLAASSNSIDALAAKLLEQRLGYVPRPFVCGASGCRYITQSEEGLRSHIDALHVAELTYNCPHCNCSLTKENANDAIDAVKHLRFHGPKLYKCPVCEFHDYTKATVDKHLVDIHPRCKDTTMVLRPKLTDPSKTGKIIKWKCNVCSKGVFDTRSLVRNHMDQVHRLEFQYKCTHANCSFQNDTKNSVKEHITSVHGVSDAGLLETVYERVEGETDVTPIWRRDDPNRVSSR